MSHNMHRSITLLTIRRLIANLRTTRVWVIIAWVEARYLRFVRALIEESKLEREVILKKWGSLKSWTIVVSKKVWMGGNIRICYQGKDKIWQLYMKNLIESLARVKCQISKVKNSHRSNFHRTHSQKYLRTFQASKIKSLWNNKWTEC